MKTQLDALKFVLRDDDRGLVPAFSCLHFYDDRVQTTSGHITLDAPWPGENLGITVPMKPVIRLLAAEPTETVGVVKGRGGDVRLRAGVYNSKLLPFTDEFPRTAYDHQVAGLPEAVVIPGAVFPRFVAAFAALEPFISRDASRPWSQYILMRRGALWATNNIVLARYDLGGEPIESGDIVFDLSTVHHVLRLVALGNEVEYAMCQPSVFRVMFKDGAWARFSNMGITWPSTDSFEAALSAEGSEIPPHLLSHVETIGKIAEAGGDEFVYLYEKGALVEVGTTAARADYSSFPRCAFTRSSLVNVLRYAKRWDLTQYPKPVPFSGDHFRGIIMGMRDADSRITQLLQGDTDVVAPSE